MEYRIPCPHCGEDVTMYRNPVPTVDVVIFVPGDCPEEDGVVLVNRLNPPHGWALPGGFVDYGESCERAAVREMKEETNLDVRLMDVLGVYSDPARDPRHHTMSVVYAGVAEDISRLEAGDDAGEVRIFRLDELPDLAFDHGAILGDFIRGHKRLKQP